MIVVPEARWSCPNCHMTDVTHDPRPHSRFHNCPGLRGLSAPFVQDGIACKVEANERDDYVGSEIVHTDPDGRPIMSITTTRDDGTDCVAFPGTATGHVDD
jgi:hypothetical protein